MLRLRHVYKKYFRIDIDSNFKRGKMLFFLNSIFARRSVKRELESKCCVSVKLAGCITVIEKIPNLLTL